MDIFDFEHLFSNYWLINKTANDHLAWENALLFSRGFQLGMAVGHIYYVLEDDFPTPPGGMKLLKTPRILRILCDGETDDDVAYQPLPEGDRPGVYFYQGFWFNLDI